MIDKRKSKMQIVYDFFKSEIESGAYLPGELFPSEAHISNQFNVSRPTIAKAKNLLREQGFITRKKGYGTIVASNKQTNKKEELKLGILIPSVGITGIFEPICGMIADRSNINGFKLMVNEDNFSLMWGRGGKNCENNGRNAELLARRYAEEGVDGIFFTPLELFEGAAEVNKKVVDICNRASIPFVLIDSDLTDYPVTSNYDVVSLDHVESGYLVAQHLINNGCKNIGFLTAPNVARTIRKRIAGARLAIAEAGLPAGALKVLEHEWMGENNGRTIKACRSLDSLICFNDTAAATMLPDLIADGFDIPAKFKVVGFDDANYAELLKIPLSSFRQPCEAIAECAVQTLLSRIKNPGLPARKIHVKGTLIERESSVLSHRKTETEPETAEEETE